MNKYQLKAYRKKLAAKKGNNPGFNYRDVASVLRPELLNKLPARRLKQ